MEQMNENNYLRREDLIYWIDKWFVQETAKERIGRELNEDELIRFTKSIEWGLWDAAYETIKIAIDVTIEEP